jgi:hypothetical protein
MMNPVSWQVIKKWAKPIAIVFFAIYMLGVLLWSWPRTSQCPVEEHSFQGKKLDVEICSGYGSERGYIGILIYSKEGDLLAWRKGTFAKEGRLNYMAIEENLIRYSDDTSDLRSASIPEDCVLNMPPNWVDWIEARLPGGIPGVKHCGTVSDEISAKARQSWRIRVEAEIQKQEQALHGNNVRLQASPPKPGASK